LGQGGDPIGNLTSTHAFINHILLIVANSKSKHFRNQVNDVARGGAEEAAAFPEILRKLKNYFNGL